MYCVSDDYAREKKEKIINSISFKFEELVDLGDINNMEIFFNNCTDLEKEELIKCNNYIMIEPRWRYNPLRQAILNNNIKVFEYLLKKGIKDPGQLYDCGSDPCPFFESALNATYTTEFGLCNPKWDFLKLLKKNKALPDKYKIHREIRDLINYRDELKTQRSLNNECPYLNRLINYINYINLK